MLLVPYREAWHWISKMYRMEHSNRGEWAYFATCAINSFHGVGQSEALSFFNGLLHDEICRLLCVSCIVEHYHISGLQFSFRYFRLLELDMI